MSGWNGRARNTVRSLLASHFFAHILPQESAQDSTWFLTTKVNHDLRLCAMPARPNDSVQVGLNLQGYAPLATTKSKRRERARFDLVVSEHYDRQLSATIGDTTSRWLTESRRPHQSQFLSDGAFRSWAYEGGRLQPWHGPPFS